MRGKILRTCEQNNSTVTQSRNTVHDDYLFKEEEMGSVGELSTVCSQIVLKCFLSSYWRTFFLWTVNKLARSITKWTKACDKRLAPLIYYIHHTCEFRQYCHVGNTAQQCRLGLFQDSDFAGDLKTRSQHQEDYCALSEVTRPCRYVRCARNRVQFHTVPQKLK